MATEIKARVSLDSSAFSAGIGRITGMVSGLPRMFASTVGRISGILAPLAGGAGLAGIAIGVKNALDEGGRLSDLSARTGVAVSELAILGKAFENAGLSASDVGPQVNRMQRSLSGVSEESKQFTDTIQSLGLDLDALRAMTPTEQLTALGKAIAGLPSATDRAAAAMNIFGRSGGQMLVLFRDTAALEIATQQIAAQAAVLEKNAAVMDHVSDAFASTKTTLRGFFVGVVDPLLPMLKQVADFLNGIAASAVALGQKVGASLRDGLNILINAQNEGKLGELIGLSLKIAFGEAVNFLAGGLRTALLGLAAVVVNLFSKDTLVVLSDGLIGVAQKFTATILTGFGDVISFISAGLNTAVINMLAALPEFVKSSIGMEGLQPTTFKEEFNRNKESTLPDFVKTLSDDADSRLNNAGDAIKNIFGRIAEDMKAVGQDFTPAQIFNTAEWKEQLAALAASLGTSVESVQAVAQSAFGTTGDGANIGAELKRSEAVSKIARVGGETGIRGSNLQGQNPAVAHAKLTADNTRTANTLLQNILAVQEQIRNRIGIQQAAVLV